MEHLKYLAWFNYAFAAINGLVLGLVMLGGLAMGASMLMSGGDDMTPLIIVGVTVALSAFIILLLTVGYALAGRRVSAGRGRILQTILAVLGITSFPIGTIYGGYALWVCWMNEDTKKVFDEPYGLLP